MKQFRRFLPFVLSVFCVMTVMANDEGDVSEFSCNATLKDLTGNQISVQDFASNGKITVFSFWATWCSPCKKELNNLSDLYEEWLDEYDFEIVAINVDDQRNMAKVAPYVNGSGWEFQVLLDPNEELKRSLNFQSVPYTFVIDAEGHVVYRHTGYVEGDEYELEDLLIELSE